MAPAQERALRESAITRSSTTHPLMWKSKTYRLGSEVAEVREVGLGSNSDNWIG